MSRSQLLGVGGSKAESVMFFPASAQKSSAVHGSQMVLRIELRGEEGVK